MCLALIGAAVSAAGAIAGAQAQAASYKTQAKLAERQGQIEAQKGAYEAGRASDMADRRLAGMRGEFLSSGVALEGSTLDVLQDSATEASLDTQAIKYGSKLRSENLNFEAKIMRSNAKSAMTGGIMGAASSLIGGLTNAYSNSQQQALSQRGFETDRTYIRNPYGAGLY
jgi:hypothetical protein